MGWLEAISKVYCIVKKQDMEHTSLTVQKRGGHRHLLNVFHISRSYTYTCV